MKKTFFRTIIMITLFFLSSCVVLPKKVQDDYNDCQLTTRQLTLEVVGDPSETIDVLDQLNTACDNPACMLIVAPYITIGAGVTVVSGSIMVVNNTIHWIEKESVCDDGIIKNSTEAISQLAEDTGATIINKADDLYRWFKGRI